MPSTHLRIVKHLDHSRRVASFVLIAGALVLMACSHAVAQKVAPTDPIPVTPYVTVTVNAGSGTVDVSPRVSFVRLGGTMEFRVVGLPADQTLEIDYRVEGSKKGPFLKTEADPRGRVTFRQGVDKVLLRYDDTIQETAVWKYDVALRDGKRVDLKVIDPMTIGKGN